MFEEEKKVTVVKEAVGSAVVVMDSVGHLTPEMTGQIIVAGSHGSAPAARHAAGMAPFGIILNDAGQGKNDAGISGLAVLEAMGVLGATVDCNTGRIGDGLDCYNAGRLSAVNDASRQVGLRVGMSVVEATELMLGAKRAARDKQKVYVIHEEAAGRIVAADTITSINKSHTGAVVVCGSHCAEMTYHWVEGVNLRAIFLNDAGWGKGNAGISGLPVYDAAGIPAGAVGCQTAMIGHAADAWENGILSAVNQAAKSLGLEPGLKVRDAALTALRAK